MKSVNYKRVDNLFPDHAFFHCFSKDVNRLANIADVAQISTTDVKVPRLHGIHFVRECRI